MKLIEALALAALVGVGVFLGMLAYDEYKGQDTFKFRSPWVNIDVEEEHN